LVFFSVGFFCVAGVAAAAPPDPFLGGFLCPLLIRPLALLPFLLVRSPLLWWRAPSAGFSVPLGGLVAFPSAWVVAAFPSACPLLLMLFLLLVGWVSAFSLAVRFFSVPVSLLAPSSVLPLFWLIFRFPMSAPSVLPFLRSAFASLPVGGVFARVVVSPGQVASLVSASGRVLDPSAWSLVCSVSGGGGWLLLAPLAPGSCVHQVSLF
jgi:hypothetical protein